MFDVSRKDEERTQATTDDLALELRAMLESVRKFYGRFVVFRSEHEAVAMALWVAHCWTFAASNYTPYPYASSPERESGKSRFLEVTGELVPKAWYVDAPSEAVVYRTIEKYQPTILLDECDAIFSDKKDSEGMRALLNAGFERDRVVPRCVGPKHEVHNFNVYCPKALAGIGRLPDTLESRKIPINLKRKTRSEKVERFRKRDLKTETDELRADLSGWAKAHTNELVDATPDLPESLTDRQQDIWEPLLAIADLAGEEWSVKAREAAESLHDSDSAESLGELLLEHIREAFGDRDKISTVDLLHKLTDNDAGPWGSWWGKDLSFTNTNGPSARLARLLRDFEIKSKKIRDGNITSMGYEKAMFADAWNRYLPGR